MSYSFKKSFPLILFLILLTSTVNIAQHDEALNIAVEHLKLKAKDLNLTNTDILNYRISDLYRSKHNGVTHVYLNQEFEGIPVYTAIININVLPNGKVLNMGNRFIADLQAKVNASTPSIGPGIALQRLLDEFEIQTDIPLRLKQQINDHHFIFENDNLALEPIPVKLVYQAMPDKRVRLAWNVEFYQLDAQHWWNARIDAHTGDLLAHHDQVIHCNFDVDHDHDECTDHSISKTNNLQKNEKANSAVVPNSYNVFAMPLESPNQGERTLEINPADPIASPHGWHDTDNMPGPEFTITRGNNAHAYQDIFNNDSSIGDEPDGGPDLEFDFPLDLSTGRPYTQIPAAVTNLFYWNNVMHDVWYNYGFDEAAGNFQVNNYGNGGTQGDWVRAEALDGSGSNNANFGTGGDGSQARMQMFIWGGSPVTGGLEVVEPETLAGNYEIATAAFGGALPLTPIVSPVVLVDDGSGTTSDACEPITNGTDISGKIAMIDRGTCEFGFKARAAENQGAIAVIVCNNVGGGVIPMGAGAVGGQVTIPAVMVSLADCNQLKTRLDNLVVSLKRLDPTDIPMPGPSGRDSDFDNGIIAHEYTHGISARLTGGPSTGFECLSNNEQAGEGWSDWFALAMQTTVNDNPEEARPIGTYASGSGIRPFPYSRNMDINPHIYANINSEAIPHGVGSVWAVMIWDLYWNLVDVYDFDEDFYNGSGGNNRAMQLVLDGLKLQPCNPTFVDARDAIIAADEANYNGENKCLIWETFARRGLGADATAGGGLSFDLPDECDLALKINKTALTEVEAGGTLTYSISYTNDSGEDLQNVRVTDELPAGTSYVEGSSTAPNTEVNGNIIGFNLGDVANSFTNTYTYQVTVDPEPFSFTFFEDNVEAGTGNWFISNSIPPTNWNLNTSNTFDGTFAWFAPNIDTQSDQYLSFSQLISITGSNPVLSFWHSYSTEADWDGGVLEISTDNGMNWFDLGNAAFKNPYNSTIEDNPDSAISGRRAFSGSSGGYIQTLVSLSNFVNRDVVIRWRFATDALVGGDGWYVDNVRLFGNYHSITNKACILSNSSEERCAEIETIVFGDETTATENITNSSQVILAPNPAEQYVSVNVNSTADQEVSINLLTIDGKQLNLSKIGRTNQVFNFNLENLKAGIYLVSVQTGQEHIVKKLVVN